MQSGTQSQLFTVVIYIAIVGWIVYRRLLPQQVRPGRTIGITVVIVLLSLVGAVQNPRILGEPLFLILVPVMLLIGFGLGLQLMKTIHFWHDDKSGQLWMRGGVAYLAIWLFTALLRYGVEYLATGSFVPTGPAPVSAPTTLGIIAADMLFISVGLWIARGYSLVQKSNEKARPPASPQL